MYYGVLALIFSLVSLVCNIVELATPYWYSITEQKYVFYFGFWKSCNVYKHYTTCNSFPYPYNPSGQLHTARALEVGAVLLITTATVCLALSLTILRDRFRFLILAGCLPCISGSLMIAGGIMFLTDDNVKSTVKYYDMTIHVNLFLCIIACITANVASVLSFSYLAIKINQQRNRKGAVHSTELGFI